MKARLKQEINLTLRYILLFNCLLVSLISAQEVPQAIRLEARFSLLGEVKDDYLSAKINVFTLPNETQYKSLGLFWKADVQTEGEVFYSGQGLNLEGYVLAYAEGQAAQMHMTLEPTATRPLLHGALLGVTGRLNLDNYSEPTLSENTPITFSLKSIENNPNLRGTLIFSFTDEHGKAFIGAGLVLASEQKSEIELSKGTVEAFSIQDGPSSSTRYASFQIRLANEQSLNVPLALIMPEQVFRSEGE